MAFTRLLPVRFDDVDFARIVYFPRLFAYCHEVFEDFFAAEVGSPYAHFVADEKIGFPAVNASADFRAPLKFGQTCRIELRAERIGRTSLTCQYELTEHASNISCATVRVVTVATHLEEMVPKSLPDIIRTAFERHRA